MPARRVCIRRSEWETASRKCYVLAAFLPLPVIFMLLLQHTMHTVVLTGNKDHLSEAAFLEAVKNSQGIIYKLVGLYANDAEERKDLYQEVLLQAWKSWPGFRGDSKFSTWLYRISLNTILTQKRKPLRIAYMESLETVDFGSSEQSVKKEETERLRKAIRSLPETDRALVSMHLDGYENPEIAAVLGISVNHVAVKLHRCKQQLANLLKQ